MWLQDCRMYQIYPIGFCGAPLENDNIEEPRILKVLDWMEHMKKLGMNTVLFNPLFESDRHGYDTRDYRKVDCRLGSNENLKQVCTALHENGIRVIFDGVFNHVGRGFWAFQDVLLHRESSPYRDWFYINFQGDNGYQDGLYYEGWEGCYDLVKLNLKNPAVTEYLLESTRFWVNEFGIDGLRLDVAYCIEPDFLKQVRRFCDELKEDFVLIGEVLFGDYKRIVNADMLQSCTNYECYKGIYSSCNDYNLFEISYSLNRQFGDNGHAIYNGMEMLSFVDNHDVSRIASMLKEKRHLPVAFAIAYLMPGFPCVYYGSEWGAEGEKKDGDPALRPYFEAPKWNELTSWIQTLNRIRQESEAVRTGSYANLMITNKQLVFERRTAKERVVAAMNLDGCEYEMDLKTGACTAINLVTGEETALNGRAVLPPYGVLIYEIL